jgi:hypothetical protein
MPFAGIAIQGLQRPLTIVRHGHERKVVKGSYVSIQRMG